MKRADGFIQNACKLLEDEKEARKSCFNGLCPNLKSQYQLSREARKKAGVSVQILGDGLFELVALSPFIPQPSERLPELPFTAIFHPLKEPRKTPLPKSDPSGKSPTPLNNLPHWLTFNVLKKDFKGLRFHIKTTTSNKRPLLQPCLFHGRIVASATNFLNSIPSEKNYNMSFVLRYISQL